ncbi:MAG: hypothetical protein WA948_00560 [Pontixanthobacter sp.]
MTSTFVLWATATLVAVSAPSSAQPAPVKDLGLPTASSPTLGLEQTTGLKCAAAFAIVAQRQSTRDEGVSRYPPLTDRGREFFVRVSAQLIDETGIDRTQLTQRLRAEAEGLQADGAIDAVMPSCLLLLDASGL